MSDRRLKDKIILMGERCGLPLYCWTWNDEGEKLGLNGQSYGHMADEVAQKYPDAIGERAGYMSVDYGKVEELAA